MTHAHDHPDKTRPKTHPGNRTRGQQVRGQGHRDGMKPKGRDSAQGRAAAPQAR